MDDIINKILKMDEAARKLDDEAQAEKIASREEVLKIRKQVYDEYLNSAEKHLNYFKASAKKSSDEKWKEIEKYYDRVSLKLDKLYNDNKKKWIDEIVSGVIAD